MLSVPDVEEAVSCMEEADTSVATAVTAADTTAVAITGITGIITEFPERLSLTPRVHRHDRNV